MKINHHKLVDARQTPSPNFTERAQGEEISLLVIHNISLPPGEYGGNYIDDLFCNCLDYSAHPYFKDLKDLRVSSHLLINRQGQVTQYVPFDMKAHHAGESSFQGRERCNDFSIGIELEGCDEEPFTDSQYATLAEITGLLMQHYPGIQADRITGHSDIAPTRKTDPGPCFDWGRYLEMVSN
jgi:AmpD protein